jgi:hypothetical protein
MERTAPNPRPGYEVSAPEYEALATICAVIKESKRPPCEVCGTPMEPEHAHYRCPACAYILPCCGW